MWKVFGFQSYQLLLSSSGLRTLGLWMAGEKAAGSEFWVFQSQSKIGSLSTAFLLQQFKEYWGRQNLDTVLVEVSPVFVRNFGDSPNLSFLF